MGGRPNGLDRWQGLARSMRTWATQPTSLRDWWRMLPGDLLGLMIVRLVGIEGEGRLHDDGDVQAMVFEDPKIGYYFRAQLMPVRAQTLGRIVLAPGPLDEETLDHECEHIRQWSRLGPCYLPAYFGSSLLAYLRGGKPYWDNAFETAARDRATRDREARDREALEHAADSVAAADSAAAERLPQASPPLGTALATEGLPRSVVGD